jgi:DNA-binding response OmpR family regulator
MYADYLGWRGIDVREVVSATAALDQLSTFTPDAAVVEDRLTDARGLDLVRALRRRRRTSRLPLALLSSDVFGIDTARARASGCDRLLSVPCLPETLYDALVHLVIERAREAPRPQPDSWLFVGADAAVMILRQAERELKICGPGRRRRVRQFASEVDLLRFQVRLEERLAGKGFVLEGFCADRRRGGDRREAPRAEERRVPV